MPEFRTKRTNKTFCTLSELLRCMGAYQRKNIDLDQVGFEPGKPKEGESETMEGQFIGFEDRYTQDPILHYMFEHTHGESESDKNKTTTKPISNHYPGDRAKILIADRCLVPFFHCIYFLENEEKSIYVMPMNDRAFAFFRNAKPQNQRKGYVPKQGYWMSIYRFYQFCSLLRKKPLPKGEIDLACVEYLGLPKGSTYDDLRSIPFKEYPLPEMDWK